MIEFDPLIRNDGAVKLNTGNGVKPRWDSTTSSLDNNWRRIQYDDPKGFSSFPTTSWPKNILDPNPLHFYNPASHTFIENTIAGQVQLWRITFNYLRNATASTLFIRIRNPLSGFITQSIVSFSGDSDPTQSGQFTVLLLTIADEASLPAPYGTGLGYYIEVRVDDNSFQSSSNFFLEVDSVTRISQHYSLPR